MGLKDALPSWWPVAVLLALVGGVGIAFTRCAVTEVAVRLAARLYAGSSAERDRWREEWLRSVEDMHPAERPAEAGSLLWVGVREATVRRFAVRRGESARGVDADATGRYRHCLEQLRSEDAEIRLAGIRGLKRFALDPAAQVEGGVDWRTALHVLAALARSLSTEAVRSPPGGGLTGDGGRLPPERVAGVMEAVRVLGSFPQLSGRWSTLKHDLSAVALASADLARLELPRADLSGADLRRADLRRANLRAANLTGADLSHGDLRGAHLRGACLRRACLRRADLGYASVRGADLSYADLRGADLTAVNVRGVNLRGADLRGADLTRANLVSVDPVRLDLRVADAPHAWLATVVYDATTVWPAGFDPTEAERAAER